MNVSFVHSLLLGLCANYPPSNVTVKKPPPWQWIPEKHVMKNQNGTFECYLKSGKQIKKESLRGRTLRVVTLPDRPPLSWVTYGKNNTLIGHGIAFEVLKTLSKKFQFSYNVYIPSKKTLVNENGSLLYMVTSGEVDMAAAFVPMLPGLDNELQWGVELSYFEYVVLMKRPKESATGSGLLAPFEMEVWLLILVSVAVVGPIIHGIMRLRSRICNDGRVYSLSSCVWFVYGALMKQGSSLSPDKDSTRIMFATWWLFIMILTAFYTANLTAFLTLSRFTLPIHSVEDIANPIYRWAALEGDAIEYSVKKDDDLSSLRQSWREGRGKFLNTVDSLRIKPLIAEGVLLLHERNWLNFFMLGIERSVQDENEHCKYVLTTRSYLTRPLSFAFPKHSVLPRIFNADMLSYVESGIIKHLLTKDLPDAVVCPLNLGSKERQLRSTDLYITYAIIISGFFIASMVFTFEMTRKWMQRRITPWKFDKRSCTMKTDDMSIRKSFAYINGIRMKNLDNRLKLIPANGLSALLFNK